MSLLKIDIRNMTIGVLHERSNAVSPGLTLLTLFLYPTRVPRVIHIPRRSSSGRVNICSQGKQRPQLDTAAPEVDIQMLQCPAEDSRMNLTNICVFSAG